MGALVTPCKTLYERVDELIQPQGESWPFRHSSTTHAAIAGLISRSQVLEEAIREMALEIQKLAAEHQKLEAHTLND
jgi:metal-responsive CopG/Arc/MetJ family transcriptional regulator